MDLRGITCKLATFAKKYRFYSNDKSDNCILIGSRFIIIYMIYADLTHSVGKMPRSSISEKIIWRIRMKNDDVHTTIKYSMRWKILGLTLIPMLFVTAIIMTIALKGMRNSLRSETSSGLEELANSLLAGICTLDLGEWILYEDKLYKGAVCLSDNSYILDRFMSGRTQASLYYQNTSYVTTLLDQMIQDKLNDILLTAFLLITFGSMICVFISNKMTARIIQSEHVINQLSKGNLKTVLPRKQMTTWDEIGEMLKALEKLKELLTEIVKGIFESSGRHFTENSYSDGKARDDCRTDRRNGYADTRHCVRSPKVLRNRA